MPWDNDPSRMRLSTMDASEDCTVGALRRDNFLPLPRSTSQRGRADFAKASSRYHKSQRRCPFPLIQTSFTRRHPVIKACPHRSLPTDNRNVNQTQPHRELTFRKYFSSSSMALNEVESVDSHSSWDETCLVTTIVWGGCVCERGEV